MKIRDIDELLLDVLNQACGNERGHIDNECLSAYEHACSYLKKKGLLEELNGRIYKIVDTQNSEKKCKDKYCDYYDVNYPKNCSTSPCSKKTVKGK